jgi:hypothetical protein
MPKLKDKSDLIACSVVAGLLILYICLVFEPGQRVAGVIAAAYALAITLGLIASVTLLTFTPVLMHELGHLIAAKRLGFGVTAFQVGPFVIRWTGRKAKLQWFRGRLAGHVQTFPLHMENLRTRYLEMIKGGPTGDFVSICLGSSVAAYYALLASNEGSTRARVLIACALLVLLSSLQLLNFIRGPKRSRDAQMIKELREPYGNAVAAHWAARSIWIRGARPRDWDARLLDDATDPRLDYLARVNVLTMRYFHAIDLKDLDEARRWLHQALGEIPEQPKGAGEVRRFIEIENAFIEGMRGVVEPLPELADHEVFGGYLRAKAAVASAEGRVKDAIRLSEEARANIEANEDTDMDHVQAELEWLLEFEANMKDRLNAIA